MLLRTIGSSLVLFALAAACGGDGDSGSSDASGLEKAAAEYGRAILENDAGTVYDLLAEECRDTVSERDVRGALALGTALIAGFLEVDLDDISVDGVETRNVEDGRGEARILLSVPGEAADAFEGFEYEAWVYEDGWRLAECESYEGFSGSDDGDIDDGDGEDDGDTVRTGPGSSRDEPLPLGQPTEVAGWEIRVNSVNPDAEEVVVAEDSFNGPPEPGEVFVLVNLRVTYLGDGESESATLGFAVEFGAVGRSAIGYNLFEDSCAFSTPDELPRSREVFEGGTIEGNICLSVAEEDADSLLLFVDESFNFDDSGRAWFALR